MEELSKYFNKILLNLDKNLDHQDIDDFLRLLNESVDRQYRQITETIETVPSDQLDYRAYLEDKLSDAVFISFLGDELSILALYKKVEIQSLRTIKRCIPSLFKNGKNKKTPYFSIIKDEIKKHIPSFKHENISGYFAFNELRLLNNAIKHDGLVSEDLAKSFPSWGDAGTELTGRLGDAYIRLLPEIKIFVADLVEIVGQ